jgi:hypothetical protein
VVGSTVVAQGRGSGVWSDLHATDGVDGVSRFVAVGQRVEGDRLGDVGEAHLAQGQQLGAPVGMKALDERCGAQDLARTGVSGGAGGQVDRPSEHVAGVLDHGPEVDAGAYRGVVVDGVDGRDELGGDVQRVVRRGGDDQARVAEGLDQPHVTAQQSPGGGCELRGHLEAVEVAVGLGQGRVAVEVGEQHGALVSTRSASHLHRAAGPERAVGALCCQFARHAAAGGLEIGDPDLAASHYLSLTVGEARQRDIEVDDIAVDELIRAGVRVLLSGYRVGPERGMIAGELPPSV